ncbi:uncharacterized protein LOC129597828 [Paramacrobiotus metropolitanus]|uniref:uncharacterized protein LOC129597828 n=1 Tax=Paramacrobiotus metropolitanus TaxID=2943436 RepID=UPI002445C6E8|nr:uncharacterized protein LOC129597828 [Paramacrobiotus metropolitanus]
MQSKKVLLYILLHLVSIWSITSGKSVWKCRVRTAQSPCLDEICQWRLLDKFPPKLYDCPPLVTQPLLLNARSKPVSSMQTMPRGPMEIRSDVALASVNGINAAQSKRPDSKAIPPVPKSSRRWAHPGGLLFGHPHLRWTPKAT